MLIDVDKLCYKSGKRYLLKNIQWQVNPGEHWLIFGMNGSGKTTLLSIIAGFKSQTSGSIKVYDQVYSSDNIFELRKKIGIVSSSLFDRIYKNESALEIVLSGVCGAFGLNFSINPDDVRLAKALLRELHIGDKIYQTYNTMSKGERQNVLIARALITKPEILILDEPSSGLDLYARAHLATTIEKLALSGKVTIIYVTHYPEEIPSYIQKAMLLRNGQIFAKGSVKDLLTSTRITALLNKETDVYIDADGIFHMKLDTTSDIYELCYE
ncbi:MAG: ATP-binding cassette domain-containing protein [Peptococcaceae bacterium]|nr:ATP-binding cassette domain-containing protein [Peptococcaceae bacterium]